MTTPTKLKPVDAVVVGSGVVGSIICMELANAGLKVLCLERGRSAETQKDFVMPYVQDELKFDRHSDIFQNLSRETITFRNNMGEQIEESKEHAFDVRRQRRIVFDVITRVLPHNVDDARARLLRVMQIGQTIAQPRPQMQQRGRGFISHAVITIRRAAAHALEQAQHAAHALNPIQCTDKMHLRSAGVGEAHIHPAF